jgi:hypothetical protein
MLWGSQISIRGCGLVADHPYALAGGKIQTSALKAHRHFCLMTSIENNGENGLMKRLATSKVAPHHPYAEKRSGAKFGGKTPRFWRAVRLRRSGQELHEVADRRKNARQNAFPSAETLPHITTDVIPKICTHQIAGGAPKLKITSFWVGACRSPKGDSFLTSTRSSSSICNRGRRSEGRVRIAPACTILQDPA